MKDDILKKAKEYGSLELLAKQLVEGFVTGLHRSPYHGFSVEFAEHRTYNPGESTRHIDWKVFAKTEKLFVKRYEEETNLRCLIVIDNSSSMHYPEKNQAKIKFSIVAAAALAHLLQKQRDAVGLCTFSEAIEAQSQIKSTPSHLHTILGTLQGLLSERPKLHKTSAAKVIHQIADKVHKRSLVILFSDMIGNSENQEELFSALQHLKHRKHEILLFHVLDKSTELDFEFEDRPYIFQDIETGEEVKLQPAEVKDYYRRQAGENFKELVARCGKYKIDLVEADVAKSIDQVLLPYLIKRKKMV